ncbi:MAG: hypothetical protein HY654_06985, partial [Acidobacteria bacterium]|nr:hypothetical protein [Acidobacteriota bacterium]
MIHLAFDPALVEEAVLLAEGRLPEADARAFRRERNKIYDITDPDRREKRFRSFHQDWFTLMRLDLAVRQTLGEYPGITSRLLSGRVVRAFDPREEGADLVDRLVAGAPDPQPVLVIRLRPASLANPDGLAPLLR